VRCSASFDPPQHPRRTHMSYPLPPRSICLAWGHLLTIR
jgi:hypothetical protein